MPLSPYGIAKLAVEKYLNYYKNIFGLQFVSLRFANIYGPRQNPKGEAGVISIFSDAMLTDKKLVMNGDGLQTRDFVFVGDVVRANILAMEGEKSGIFNVGTGIETNIDTIFRKLRDLTGSNCAEIRGPDKPGELMRSSLDYGKIKETFGWQPEYKLDRGLKETADWFKNQLKQ